MGNVEIYDNVISEKERNQEEKQIDDNTNNLEEKNYKQGKCLLAKFNGNYVHKVKEKKNLNQEGNIRVCQNEPMVSCILKHWKKNRLIKPYHRLVLYWILKYQLFQIFFMMEQHFLKDYSHNMMMCF